MHNNTAYTLGRLTAALGADARTVYRACESPAVLAPLIAAATADADQRDRIAPLMEQLHNIPQTQGNEEQSAFMLGYYHERHQQRTGIAPPTEEPPADARIEVRLDSDLKRWVLDNGGAALVRALLRAERERGES